MKWSLLELQKFKETPLTFDTALDLTTLMKEKESMILDSEPVKVKGFISASSDSYILHYELSAILTLPSTRSLEPVAYPMSFSVDELFMTPEQFKEKSEEVEEHDVLLIDAQTISLDESVADNIVLSIPLQVLTEDEKEGKILPSGNGWNVFSEEEYVVSIEEEQQNEIDPRLAKLSELFKESNE